MVQPLVREAARAGVSVTELTDILRSSHGRAYRRSDMLADLRRYRDIERMSYSIVRYIDPRRRIAHAGVAVFGLALLIPSVASEITRPPTPAIIASSTDTHAAPAYEVPPSDPVARTRLSVEEAPAPPAPPPTQGVVVTASWYGPGFFENRLPCWQWLAANDQPIQLAPETWGVAHRTLPCGTMLTLAHGPNVVRVPVVDRGPYIDGRDLDLSPRVKAALGCTDLCTVLMQIR